MAKSESKSKGSEPEEWEILWNARQAALEKVLGKADDAVIHAAIPFNFGGFADIICFHPKGMGATYVTADLIGMKGQKQPKELGNFELMICHRDDKEMWGPSLIRELARYTHEALLSPWDTMDMGPALPKKSTLAGLLFVPYARFKLFHKLCGIMLCLGITKAELAFKMEQGPKAFMERLKQSGVYPFTELKRKSLM
jgi:hypothetical protein